VEDTLIVKVVAQRNYNLCRKGTNPNIPSSKDDKIPLRKITPNPSTLNPNDQTQGKTNGKLGKIVPTKTNKPSISN